MENNSTAPLRKAAPDWSLAGDKQLLDILQNIHQSLMTRCQEVNLRLDEMVAVLDDASVDLQNVNNKFMALSNSQFIESRVYDDEEDVATQAPAKESPKHQTPDPSTCFKASVRILHGAHETIRILASDTDTDTDDEDGARMVLKPKDTYSHRPLPHIIGSHAWKTKWHAGLHAEESDSDSVVSKPDGEEYSDSEPEALRDGGHPSRMDDEQESVTGSEAMSEQELSLPPPKPSPADVAAALARRLRGGTPQMPDEDFAYSPPLPASRKVYRPEKPAPGVIFSDDPPPFEDNQSEEGQYSPEDDDDIFAELHKNKPNANSNKVQNAAEDMSSLKYRKDHQGDLFDDLKDDKVTPHPANQKTTLYEDESEPELFVTKPTVRDTVERGSAPPNAEAVKKPIGGISLFGSNKGAESIGAAILKRNQRKSSSEEEKLIKASPKPIPKETTLKTTEKDIFDNLFAKSVKEKKVTKEIKEAKVVSNKESKADKVDLFSDNIFDDIDDIFTTNVVTTKTSGGNQKSLFDDVDDLFTDVAVPKSKVEVKSEDKKTSIFDSDDDLFSDNVVKPETIPKGTSETISKASVSKTIETSKENKILYEDESSDNDIFSKINESKVVSAKISNVEKEIKKEQLSNSNELPTEEIKYNADSLQDNLFTNNVINNNVAKQANAMKSKAQNTIFADDNDDSDDLFKETNKNTKYNSNKNDVGKINPNTVGSQNGTNKISLFDDEDDDTDLFYSSSNTALINKVVDAKKNELATSSSKVKDNNMFNEDFSNASKETENNNIFVNSVDTSKSDNSSKSEKNYETDVSKQKPTLFNDDSDDKLFSRNNDKLFKQNLPAKSVGDIDNKVVSQRKTQTNINTQIEKEVITEITEGISQSSSNSSDIKPPKDVDSIEQSNINSNEDTIKPEIPEPDFSDSPISEVIEEDSLFSTHRDAISNITDDIFSKITDEPPAFEKPKESKKSKNVNALFDDDSDDEALFFKKNDVVFDELPDVSADSNDPQFGIFHDEPPAIDIEFSPKTSVSNDDDFFKTESLKFSKETTSYNFNYDFLTDNEITSTEKFKTENEKLSTKVSDSDINQRFNTLNSTDDFLKTTVDDKKDNALFKTVKPVENTSSKPVIATKPIQKDTDHTHTELSKDNLEQHTKTDLNAEPVTSKIIQPSSPKRESISSDTPDSPETKKIGKLKTMNFNIDVSTLLPGASPKKKVIEQTDGPSLSTNNQEDQIKSIREDAMVKAVCFKSDPDSQILDNKISKERAKIQVKRRPSTRRARKDAVRQSVLDLGEDSTDNSNSTDDAPRVKVRKEPIESANDSDLEHSIDNLVETPISNVVSKTNKTHKQIESETANDVFESNDFTTEKEITPPENLHKPDVEINTNPELSTSEIISRRVDSKTITSKIVYILNDEDIFNTDNTKTPTNILNLEDDDDDLFKSLNSKTEVKSSVSTLGSVYKDTSKPEDTKTTENDNKTTSNVSTSKKSVLDLSDDENELFNTKKVLSKHKGILDSDSDEDLFGGKSETNKLLKVEEVKEVKRQVVVKKSLFGDDDDDDELFGAKVKVEHVAPSQPTKSQKEVSKPSEPEVVFDDPLSMLGGDDD